MKCNFANENLIIFVWVTPITMHHTFQYHKYIHYHVFSSFYLHNNKGQTDAILQTKVEWIDF